MYKRQGEDHGVRKVLLVTNESDEEQKEAARELNKNPHPEWDAVVSVLMLREGWDVRNISVILLFRKFSFKDVDGQRYSVYGKQVIGRGLRRMSKSPEEWESLFVVDHPILKHSWLWEDLRATQYPEALDPDNPIIDIPKIPEDTQGETIEQKDQTVAEAEEQLTFHNLPPTPQPPDVPEPIYEWQKFIDGYQYDFRRMLITEDVAQIKSLNLDSELATLEKGELPEISVEEIARITRTEQWPVVELKKRLVRQVHQIAHDALLEYDRNPDERQAVLVQIVRGHIKKRLLGGQEMEETDDEVALRRLWGVIDQVRDLFVRPELVEGVLAKR